MPNIVTLNGRSFVLDEHFDGEFEHFIFLKETFNMIYNSTCAFHVDLSKSLSIGLFTRTKALKRGNRDNNGNDRKSKAQNRSVLLAGTSSLAYRNQAG